MNLKKCIKGVAILTCVGLLSACNTQTTNSNPSDYVLKIAYNNSLCEAPIQMGVEKKFFDAEGIKYEMVKVDAAHMPEAIGSGQVDAGFGLLGKYLKPIDEGLDIKITAGIHTGCIKILVPNDSDIKSVADLKGKKIGTTGIGSAAPTIIARRSLYHAGLNPSDDGGDVEFVVYSGSDLAQALSNGAVDAIANGDPQASIAERDYNLRTIVDTATDEEYKNEYCCISFVTGKIANEHPELAEKFTKAIMKSSAWVANNIDETAKIQINNNWVSGDVDFNASVLKNYNYKPSLNGGLEALKITVPDLKAIGLISDKKTDESFINDAFLKLDFDENEINTQKVVEECCEATTDCCEPNTLPPDCCA